MAQSAPARRAVSHWYTERISPNHRVLFRVHPSIATDGLELPFDAPEHPNYVNICYQVHPHHSNPYLVVAMGMAVADLGRAVWVDRQGRIMALMINIAMGQAGEHGSRGAESWGEYDMAEIVEVTGVMLTNLPHKDAHTVFTDALDARMGANLPHVSGCVLVPDSEVFLAGGLIPETTHRSYLASLEPTGDFDDPPWAYIEAGKRMQGMLWVSTRGDILIEIHRIFEDHDNLVGEYSSRFPEHLAAEFIKKRLIEAVDEENFIRDLGE